MVFGQGIAVWFVHFVHQVHAVHKKLQATRLVENVFFNLKTEVRGRYRNRYRHRKWFLDGENSQSIDSDTDSDPDPERIQETLMQDLISNSGIQLRFSGLKLCASASLREKSPRISFPQKSAKELLAGASYSWFGDFFTGGI
jgi:hypothetical protein